MTKNLYEKYLYFIRRKVEKKWLSKFKYLTVLGEGFINGFYILVFEVDDSFAIDWEGFKWQNVTS